MKMLDSRHYRCISKSYSNTHLLALLLLTNLLVSPAHSSPIPTTHDLQYSGPASTKLFDQHQTFSLRVVAVTCAAACMTASFVVFCWFCRMQKRFRHRLIMILIYGDLLKATWLFLFAVASIAQGTIYTKSALCQSSGFLVHYGTETSDYAVLVMAIHSAMQVFRPSGQTRSDGLYDYRYYVYIGAFLVPGMMSGLAFINPQWGYMSQGAFCSLPLRPFWYRLALAWIPRYIIAIIIVGLAIAIYAHVGFEFRSFTNTSQNIRPSASTTTAMLSAENVEAIAAVHAPDMTEQQVVSSHRTSSILQDIATSRQAFAVVISGGAIPSHAESSDCSNYPPTSSFNIQHHSSLPPSAVQTRSTAEFSNHTRGTTPEPSHNSRGTSPLHNCPTSHIQRQLSQKRTRIHRQLRLMFIYPMVYILMWLIPFIAHCMTYKDYWAEHPIYWLAFLNVMCITLMGAVDCLVFSMREQPWRHISYSDGTLLGSFFCWWPYSHTNGVLFGRGARPSDIAHHDSFVEAGMHTIYAHEPVGGFMDSLPSIRRARHSVGTGGSSDQARIAAEMAKLRLEYEKEDRRAAGVMRGGRSVGSLVPIESPGSVLETFGIDRDKDGYAENEKRTDVRVDGSVEVRDMEKERRNEDEDGNRVCIEGRGETGAGSAKIGYSYDS